MLGTVSSSPRRRIAGAAFTAATVLAGLGLTASRGSASMIYSHNVARPGLSLFDGTVPAVAATPAADPKPVVYAALAAPAPKPIRMASAAPVTMSDAVEAAPPPPPAPPAPAVDPVAPPPPVGMDPADFRAAQRDAAAARREAAREAAQGQREAAHARAEAQREAMLARAEGQREAAHAAAEAQREAAHATAEAQREAAHASAEAQREAARAMAEGQRAAARATAAAFDSTALSARIAAETRQSLAESCPHAKPATGPETDQQAIRRLSRGCVDMAMIDRQIDVAMRQARDQIARSDMPAEARQRALEGMDRAMAHRHRAVSEQD